MNERKAIVALLTVIAVLLALNLVVKGAGSAEARGELVGGEPYVVKLLPRNSSLYWRVWSDGRVDVLDRQENCEFSVNVLYSHGPVEHDAPVVDAVQAPTDNTGTAMLTYEDGRADLIDLVNGDGVRCTITGIGTPSFCIGDTDRNGQVEFEDILNVLAQWGECSG